MLHRRVPRLFAGLFALVLALAAAPFAASAQGMAAPGGAEAFTVSGVAVDVSAANANAARDEAIAQAQRKAWDELYRRITPGGGSAPRLSDVDLARLVQGFSIDEERVSATRYLGSMTVRFRPTAVRDVLAGTGAQYAEPPTRPFVLLPVTVIGGRPVLWEDRSSWRNAWEERPEGGSLVPLLVPYGELDDIAAINVESAMQGDAEAIRRIAQKYNAAGVIVARTDLAEGGTVPAGQLSIEISRYTADQPREQQTITVKADAADRPEDLMTRAVIQTSAAIDEAWRRENTTVAGPEQRLLVSVPIGGLSEWMEVRKRLSGVNAVTRTEVLGLSRYEARIALTYRGDIPRLKQMLARRDLSLEQLPTPPRPPLVNQPVAPGQVQPPPPPVEELWQIAPLSGAGSVPVSPPPTVPVPGVGAPTRL